jgi:hypothetical protein
VISLQVGDCWLWSLIIFLIQRSCFSHVWIPFPDGGVWGGFPPHICHQGGPGGGKYFGAPPGRGSGQPPEEKFLGKFPCKIL